MRTAALVGLFLVTTTLALAPPGVGSEAQAELELSTTGPTGEFRAYRVRLHETAQIEFGGTYQGVTTTQPVLPILAAVERLDAGCAQGCGAAIFSYDFGMYGERLAVVLDIENSVLDQSFGTYDIAGGGWFTTFPLQAGDYLLLAASAPAESGTATLHLKVLGSASVLASQTGESFFARGYDLSAEKYDVHAMSTLGLYARTWKYSGGDADLTVGGRMFGYLGYHDQGGAHWEGPSPSQFGFIQDGEPGTYTAAFPAEEWFGPLCDPVLGCDPQFGDTREDPPFAIAVEVLV